VIFIISLLIGILIPSLGAARNAAKKSRTASDIRAIGTALELFKNDNESDFRHTNGYPPSFSHPPFRGWDAFEPHLGQFPFLEDVSESSPPRVYGAHWLPAMLMGMNPKNPGYVKRSSVPLDLRGEPWRWYSDRPHEGGEPQPLARAALYMEPDSVKTVPTQSVRGRRPSEDHMDALFPDWDNMRTLPVMVDAFEQPILYYAANRHGRATNMVEDVHEENNQYTGSTQEVGPPYYFHQDNIGFTGTGSDDPNEVTGWNLGGGEHAIAKSGFDLTPDLLVDPGHEDYQKNFAWFVLDRQARRQLEIELAEGNEVDSETQIKPVNPDSFILLSAGVDGRYGTSDDVANFEVIIE
jgi:type II secretory pathway pseudopilin PulG